MVQDDLIQIKVSSRFKNMLKKISQARGLPLSTYIKFMLTEQLKTDPLWNSLESLNDQSELVDKYIKALNKKEKKVTPKKAQEIISNLK
ncbi:MAG: hypothetical protein PHS44_00345 [Candidatus Dojkabacteria bacterium]|jgi:antitoxin component of RelBE/YafQ-DinJ toxin-antitoxin module|nr:hypothetical protein [Candidatus Dojkabacteria bacterium]